MKTLLLTAVFALFLSLPLFAEIKAPTGFDGKVYDGSVALFASSKELGITDRFICSAQVVKKVKGGYEVLSAGHCTPANPELAPDMKFKVASDLTAPKAYDVKLVKSTMEEPHDWAVFYLQTDDKFPVIDMGDENDSKINDKTIDVNFSLGLAKEVSMGLVSSKVQRRGPYTGFFEITQFSSHGASGSSVVSENTHKVIGIVVMGVDGATVPVGVEPISQIKKETADLDIVNAPAQETVPTPSIEPGSFLNWNIRYWLAGKK